LGTGQNPFEDLSKDYLGPQPMGTMSMLAKLTHPDSYFCHAAAEGAVAAAAAAAVVVLDLQLACGP
jgi:hypothetical protein